MEREILITDLTAMSGDSVCIAGIDRNWNTIRPVFEWSVPTRSHLYRGRRAFIFPRAVVAMQLTPHANPEAPHVEDHIWTQPESARHVKLLDQNRWQRTLNELTKPKRTPRPLFGATLQPLGQDQNRVVLPGKATYSLATVRCRRNIVLRLRERDSGGYRFALSFFDDKGEVYQNIPVTDLGLRAWATAQLRLGGTKQSVSDLLGRQLNAAEQIYLRLGLGREYDGRLWLQVNGIYSFPDWLGGRCFADFAGLPG